MRWCLAYLVAALLAWQPLSITAATLDSVVAAANSEDWRTATVEAALLDGQEGGDFYAAFVSARRLAATGRCGEAVLLFDVLTLSRPYFVPAYEGSFLCLQAMDDMEGAIARLDAMLAVLPASPQKDIVFRFRQQLDAADRPVFNLFGGAAPSSNALRQTSQTKIGVWDIASDAQGKPGVMLNVGGSITTRLLSRGRFTLSAVGTVEAGFNTASSLFEPRFTLETPMTFGGEGVQFLASPYVTTALRGGEISHVKAGLRGVVSVPLSDTISVALSANAGHASFPLQSYRDGWQFELGTSASWVVTPQTLLSGSIKSLFDLADLEEQRTAEAVLGLRIDHAFDGGLNVGLVGEAGLRFHTRPAPFQSGDNQLDRFASAQVEFSHRDIVIGPFMPQIYYRYALQDSDNPFYVYDSHDVGITLKSRF